MMSTNMMISTFLGLLYFVSQTSAIEPDGDICKSPIIVNDTEGIIPSPEFPGPYPMGKCTWILALGNSTKDIFFNIDTLDLEDVHELIFYNGPENSTVIHNFTGKQVFGIVYSNAVNTTIVLNTNAKSVPGKSQGHFSIHYTTKGCEAETNSSTGVLPSPYFAEGDGHLNCSYRIDVTDQRAVDLAFPDFALVKGNVTVFDGKNIVANLTEATKHPDDVLLSSTQILINMFLSTTHQQNFTVVYAQASECFETISLSGPRNLTSPGYPGSYENNLDCRWLIRTQENMSIRIELNDFKMADEGDYLLIRDGGSQFSKKLEMFSVGGYNRGVHYLTSSNVVWIQFITNQLFGASGFSLTLTPQRYGRRFVDDGNFTVGGDNDTTTDLLTDVITYQFETDQDSQIFGEFGREAVLWPNTLIECYDGFSTNDNLIGSFETTESFHPVFSNGNRMLLVIRGFIQNRTMTQQKLSGSFESVTNDGTLMNSLGKFGGFSLAKQHDEFPADTIWNIHNHGDEEMILLKIHAVVLGENSTLSVYEGLSAQDSKVVQIDKSASDIPQILIPMEKKGCRVTYTTGNPHDYEIDDELEETVLTATYSLVSDCNRVLSDKTAMITSPGYPNMYPYNAICTTAIPIPQNKLVHMTFTSFDLHPADNLKISQLGSEIDMLKGKSLPNDFVVSGVGNESKLLVTFSSSFMNDLSAGIHTAHGFEMKYSIIDCGGYFTANDGSLKSPGFPNITCVWLISLPKNTKFNDSVNVVNFTINCNGSGDVVIRDGLSSSAEVLSVKNTTMLAKSSVLWVAFSNSGAASKQTALFQLSYNTYECTKAHQCNNSICMHDDWRCNGLNECGDGSDEDNCPQHDDAKGYAGWILAVAIVVTFILAVALTFVAQAVYKRLRYSNYDELRDLMAPVPT